MKKCYTYISTCMGYRRYIVYYEKVIYVSHGYFSYVEMSHSIFYFIEIIDCDHNMSSVLTLI